MILLRSPCPCSGQACATLNTALYKVHSRTVEVHNSLELSLLWRFLFFLPLFPLSLLFPGTGLRENALKSGRLEKELPRAPVSPLRCSCFRKAQLDPRILDASL